MIYEYSAYGKRAHGDERDEINGLQRGEPVRSARAYVTVDSRHGVLHLPYFARQRRVGIFPYSADSFVITHKSARLKRHYYAPARYARKQVVHFRNHTANESIKILIRFGVGTFELFGKLRGIAFQVEHVGFQLFVMCGMVLVAFHAYSIRFVFRFVNIRISHEKNRDRGRRGFFVDEFV